VASNNNQQPSFIPQKRRSGFSRGGPDVLTLSAYIIFFITITVAGGLFGANYFLTADIKAKADKVDKVDDVFPQSEFDNFRRLDIRVQDGSSMIDRRLSPSRVFGLLNDSTAINVQFNDFSYRASPGGGAEVSMRGETDSFGAAAFQLVEFRKSNAITSVDISDLSLSDNRIRFQVRANLASRFVSPRLADQ